MSNPSESAADGDALDFGPYLQRYLAGDRDALAALPERERELALNLAPSFTRDDDQHGTPDAESGAPVRELDPIAVALGLVPGPEDVLGSRELQVARIRAKLDLRQLLGRLQQRGWDVSGQQILAWHKANTTVPPALMTAIAQTLSVSVVSLRGAASRSTFDAAATDYLDDVVIEAYLRDWAADLGQEPTQVRKRAHQTLASLNFRNRSEISRDDVLGLLRAIRSIDPDGSNA